MEARRRALGRGLGALIPVSEEEDTVISETQNDGSVPIGEIQPNPYQPRESWDEEAIRELADSIREKGVLQPLLVRRVGDSYQLIAGERRFRAAQLAGLERVPVTRRDVSDRESLELALVENLQRENLNPIEEARAYEQLGEEFGLTQDEIAQRVGKSRSAVANSLRLLQLPSEVREQLRSGKLSAGHARSLLAIPSQEKQIEAAQGVIDHGLSVRDTETIARQHRPEAADVERLAVESELSSALGTRVRIRAKRAGTGRIEIEYYSLAELNGLVARIIGMNQTSAAF
jgi:ParB family chromosome partitioning protein